VPRASVDVVLSNFGLIFASDPQAAVVEMVRALAPGGRIAFSAWLPGGAISQMNAVAMELVRTAIGAPPPPPPFAWHERAALTELFAGWAGLAIEQHRLTFTATSPADYLESQRLSHPMAISGFEVLERFGHAETAQQRLLRILEDGNEDDSAFRCTSRCAVVTATVPHG
jgi:SAM-dependent methyltransferase